LFARLFELLRFSAILSIQQPSSASPKYPAVPKSKSKNATKIHATALAARDAGPRLIPQTNSIPQHPKFDYYLELADVALGLRKPEPKRTTARG